MSEQDTTLDDFDKENQRSSPLGTMPKGWKIRRLGDDFNIEYGQEKTEKELLEDGFPVYGANGIIGYADEYLYDNPVVAVTCRGATCGNIHLTAPNSWITNNSLILENGNNINQQFLADALRFYSVERAISGSAQPQITATMLSKMAYPLPPLEEQRKIASVLYTVDQAIQKTEEIIKQTERLQTGLRRELVIAGIDHDEFQEMRVGPFTFEIPASWDIVPVDEACENLDKDRIPVKEAKREEMQGDIPYYGASGIIDYVDDYLFDDELILLAEDGENLLSRNLPIAFKISGKAWVNNHAHVLKPRQEFDIDYLVEYFERLNYEPFVTGSAQPKLTQTNMEMLSVPKPPEEEQAEISSVLTSVSIHKNRSEQYKEKLQRLKQGLMQDLLSGEVRTYDKDIEIVNDVLQHG